MNEKRFSQLKIYFTGLVGLVFCSILIWQYMHSGVPSHHLLNRADLPAISNWWGAILLPGLTWLLIGRVQKRIANTEPDNAQELSRNILINFVLAAIYGAVLSLSFFNGYPEVSSVLFPSILLFAIFFKVYTEEFILGFILSMSFGFGAVLPTIFASLIALLSAIVYFVVHFIWSRIKAISISPKAH